MYRGFGVLGFWGPALGRIGLVERGRGEPDWAHRLERLVGSILVQDVNGTFTLNAAMTPQGAIYDDERLAAVLTYVRKSGATRPSIIRQ